MYNAESIEALRDSGFRAKMLPLQKMKIFFDKNSHIIEELKDLIEGFLPDPIRVRFSAYAI